jgi:hypothetical protein
MPPGDGESSAEFFSPQQTNRMCGATHSTNCPRYVPSTQSNRNFLQAPPSRAKRRRAPAGSDSEAAVTTTAIRSPNVSTRMCRFRPFTLLPGSSPRSPPNSVVLTLWLSRQPAVGCLWRPAYWRTWARRVSWRRCQAPRSCHSRSSVSPGLPALATGLQSCWSPSPCAPTSSIASMSSNVLGVAARRPWALGAFFPASP